MKYRRFITLLVYLNPESLFKRTVSIRSEKDTSKIKEFSKEEKLIWGRWNNRDVNEINTINITADTWNELCDKF